MTVATWPRISSTLQVALVTRDAGQAERALERTPGLRGDADGAARRLRDVDTLDGGAVGQTEEVLHHVPSNDWLRSETSGQSSVCASSMRARKPFDRSVISPVERARRRYSQR